jgi:hypothetical protein
MREAVGERGEAYEANREPSAERIPMISGRRPPLPTWDGSSARRSEMVGRGARCPHFSCLNLPSGFDLLIPAIVRCQRVAGGVVFKVVESLERPSASYQLRELNWIG